MALPTSNDVLTMDYSYNGMPFGDVPATSAVNTGTMDYSYMGMPFVTNPSGVLGPTNLKSMFGVAKANIKSINGVPLANIKSINGVA